MLTPKSPLLSAGQRFPSLTLPSPDSRGRRPYRCSPVVDPAVERLCDDRAEPGFEWLLQRESVIQDRGIARAEIYTASGLTDPERTKRSDVALATIVAPITSSHAKRFSE